MGNLFPLKDILIFITSFADCTKLCTNKLACFIWSATSCYGFCYVYSLILPGIAVLSVATIRLFLIRFAKTMLCHDENHGQKCFQSVKYMFVIFYMHDQCPLKLESEYILLCSAVILYFIFHAEF